MNLERFMLPCLFKTLFGIECLGCGFQRSLFLLFQGQFSDAFQMYPALYSTLFFLGIFALYFLDKTKNYKKLLWISGTVNAIFIIAGYWYKHFYI